jgi:hypothetical protein
MDLPIDTTTLTFICTQVPEPRVAFGTDQQQRTAAGEPVFQLGVMFIAGDRSTVLRVRTTSEPAGVTLGHPLKVIGLIARPWSRDGKSGTSYWAQRVEPAGRAAKEAS